MKDIIVATFDSKLVFEKGEKVTAYNWFEKCAPYNFGTFIVKFRKEDELQEEETCRKIETMQMKIYNIGTYKIKSTIGCLAQIVEYDRHDKRRERNASK